MLQTLVHLCNLNFHSVKIVKCSNTESCHFDRKKKVRFLLALPLFKACDLKPLIDNWLFGLKYFVLKIFERLGPVRNRHPRDIFSGRGCQS